MLVKIEENVKIKYLRDIKSLKKDVKKFNKISLNVGKYVGKTYHVKKIRTKGENV